MNKEGKENQIPLISLDFKKKQKPKANTDRTALSSSGLKHTNAQQTISLLQKKKQYSQAIRQKNLSGRKSNREQSSHQLGFKSNGNILGSHVSGNVSQVGSSRCQKQAKRAGGKEHKQKQMIISSLHTTQSATMREEKMETRPKVRDSKRDRSKMQKIIQNEPLDSSFQNNISLISLSNFTTDKEKMSLDLSMIGRMQDISRIGGHLQLFSRVVDERINSSEEEREIEVLRKHNATFKKELAGFRKQNGTVKREVQQLKKQLAVLQERNEFLQGQNADQLKLLELLQNKHSQAETPHQTSSIESPTNDSKLKQILSNYENDLFQATSLNKRLQFKNYMLEKRLADEESMHRKQMAKEIATWKERYIKARNQNLRMKDSRGQMLLEMSISRDEIE